MGIKRSSGIRTLRRGTAFNSVVVKGPPQLNHPFWRGLIAERTQLGAAGLNCVRAAIKLPPKERRRKKQAFDAITPKTPEIPGVVGVSLSVAKARQSLGKYLGQTSRVFFQRYFGVLLI